MIKPSRLQLWNAYLGNLFEHYDTALLGFLSPFLAPLIFPGKEPVIALILTYAIIPIGMIARPIGSLVFGYIGDVYGREYALFLTMVGMAFVSGCIAFSPTYLQAGIGAPIFFCLTRVLQNFLAAGETMGGAIFLLENSPQKHHDLLSSLYSATTMGGHLLASFAVFILSYYRAIDFGWRFLYLCGCITALFGCLIRSSSNSSITSDNFLYSLKKLRKVFWEYRKQLLCIAISAGFARATYSIALVLMNGFIPIVSSIPKTEIMKINTYLLVLDFCALPFFGWVSSKMNREKIMLLASLGVLFFSLPLLTLLKDASLAVIIGVRIIFVILGVAFFAPFHAWAQQLIPKSCRYAVISFGYALGSQLLGSPTAAFSLFCFKKTGRISSIGWYWVLLALATSVTIFTTLSRKKTKILEQIS